ncbi:hypothetical protein KP509_15G003500 [Ceratopteris richardii]|nr:hypothetical protein KP509_15G003500 [Ceratopteris richardii]KAH7403983.1 hypothetical protein KP509_15G003500 [Ceratopteris richardii]
MSSLMKEPWLDGYAPVYSPDRSGKGTQVIVGTLRVVLSAEDLGPANTSNHKPTSENTKENTFSPLPSLEDPFFLLKRAFNENLHAKVVGVQTESQADFDEKDSIRPSHQKSERAPKLLNKSKTLKPLKGNQENMLQNPLFNLDRTDPPSHVDEKLRRYELEWEFEKWRHAEESKWRAALKDKETKRLAALENEWRQRENERILDIDKTRTELNNLETKFRAKLFALEKRERALVIAEEEALLRREAWNRDCAQRAADAEVAVKRLQSECEHRVELEKSKYAALREQYSVLEKRLAMSNAALADVEKQFCTYKTEHYKTSEAELLGQVMLLKQQCNDLKRSCDQAIRTKNNYKAQVQKLAKELARLHKQRTQDEAKIRAQDRGHLALQSLIEAQARKTEEEKLELRQMKEQLERLQMHENAMSTTAKGTYNSAVTDHEKNMETREAHVPPARMQASRILDNENAPKHCFAVGSNLDEAVQVSFKNGHSEVGKIMKQDSSSMGQDKDELDDWLNGDFSDLNDTFMFVDAPAKEGSSVPVMRTGLFHSSSTQPHVQLDDDLGNFDVSFYTSQLSEFQTAEIKRLTKQRSELLQTGVYTEHDRIIQGLDQEIKRLRSVDTKKFEF